MSIQGSCLCGTLRFEITGPLTAMLHCHCSRCRKQHGAPFATFATAAIDDFHWLAGEEAVDSHAVAPGGPRRFCRHCGSPAPSTAPSMGLAFIPVGLLEGDPGMRPQGHLFAGSKAGWYTIHDDLPQHDKYPPEFGNIPGLPDPEPVTAAPGRIAGSCQCGEVAYDLAKPVAMYQCHCSRCRRARGAAHGANLFCKLDDFRWLRGEDRVVDYKLPEARYYGVAFCRQCGASVPRVSAERGVVVVPVSGLDTEPGMRPMAHIFVDSKAPWFEITDELPQYPQAPPLGIAPPPTR
ncbi:MAG: GFA family protein [Steroidobacteraceae bacterium]